MRSMDIIHVQWPIPNGLGALLVKKVYDTPYVNTIHGEEVYLSKRYHTVFLLKNLVNNSIKTITNSSATRNSCIESGLNEDKLKVIPFGVDTNFFKPIHTPISKDTFRILSVGYFIERKGFEYLIRAIKEVKKKHANVKLRIIGSGPLEYDLRNLVSELKLMDEVDLVANVSDDELLYSYNSSDLFILPSIRDAQGNTEGLGVVLLEAMACQLPVIGSNVGGIPDIITDGETGFLVNEKDVNGLSMKINELIEDEAIRQKVGFAGFKLVKERFSWDNVSKLHLTLYRSIIES